MQELKKLYIKPRPSGRKLVIRPEKAEDYKAIFTVNKLAFAREAEAQLVENLRNTKGYIPELSIVAISDGNVVGHVLFSAISIKTDADNVPAIALAPVAVLPEYQSQGIGSLLIQEGVKRCQKFGHKIIIVVGHPKYYPRFGFVSARERGLMLPFKAPDEAFMVLEIVPKSLEGVSGTVVYPPEFAKVE
jgi:putative acetyltransferase